MVTNAPVQRLRRGARIQACYPVKSLPPLSALDSAFQLQEYISLLIRLDPHDVERIVAVPDKSTAEDGTEVVVDEACWIYEQLRRLAQDLSHPLITVLQQECNRATCPEMKAGEWLYLCVAHGNDGAMEQCCAIDYIIHTLDSATALLNSPRVFPSRLQIPATSHRHFSSLARRLSRVFAHAYYHHRDAFEQAEAESSLYARFLALSARFALVPQEFLVIPPRGSEDADHSRGDASAPRLPPQNQPHVQVQVHQPPAEPTLPPHQGRGGEDELDPLSIPPTTFGGQDRAPSPRRAGRSRTDTMVLTDVAAVAEELARVGGGPPPVDTEDGDEDESDPMASAIVQASSVEPEETVPQEVVEPEADITEEKVEEEEPPKEEAVPSAEAALHEEATDPFADGAETEDKEVHETDVTSPPPSAEDAVETTVEPEPEISETEAKEVEEAEEAEGGAPISTDAAEEPVPIETAAVPASTDVPEPAVEKEEVTTEDIHVADDEHIKPSGLDAAVTESVEVSTKDGEKSAEEPTDAESEDK